MGKKNKYPIITIPKDQDSPACPSECLDAIIFDYINLVFLQRNDTVFSNMQLRNNFNFLKSIRDNLKSQEGGVL